MAKASNGTPDQGVNHHGAQDLLKSLVRRIENLNEQADALKADLKEVYLEAKDEGFDTKILKEVIKRRKAGEKACLEHDELVSLYESRVNDQLPLPLNLTRERELRDQV